MRWGRHHCVMHVNNTNTSWSTPYLWPMHSSFSLSRSLYKIIVREVNRYSLASVMCGTGTLKWICEGDAPFGRIWPQKPRIGKWVGYWFTAKFCKSMFERITDNSLPMNPSNNTFILHSASRDHFTKSLFERSIDIHSCRGFRGSSHLIGKWVGYWFTAKIWQINIQPLAITLQNHCLRG
jgi:hypothetical protein